MCFKQWRGVGVRETGSRVGGFRGQFSGREASRQTDG